MKSLQHSLFIFCFLLQMPLYAQICHPNDSMALDRLANALTITSWAGLNVHQYPGVDTMPDPEGSSFYRVSIVNMSGQGLIGSLPDSLLEGDSLRYVSSINLNNNFIYYVDGQLRYDMSSPPPYLETLSLDSNYFSVDSTAIFLHILPNLDSLNLLSMNNGFQTAGVGPFSNFPLPPSNLETLLLENNPFTDTLNLTYTLQQLSALEGLNVNDNSFTAIKTPPSTATPFKQLYINSNDVLEFKDVEKVVQNISTLLNLYGNSVMDTAVHDDFTFNLVSTHPSLKVLDISHNNLTGTIPLDVFQKLDKVETLLLNNNELEGAFPTPSYTASGGLFPNQKYYQGTDNLTSLNLSSNRFEKEIRLDWLLAEQFEVHQANDGIGIPLKNCLLSNNNFDGVTPKLADPVANTMLNGGFISRFINLSLVDVAENNLSFKDLYRIKELLRFKQISSPYFDHYIPQNALDSAGFAYKTQDELGTAGVRRQRAGETITFDADESIIEPINGGASQVYMTNRYYWEKGDTSNLAGGTPSTPVYHYVGKVTQNGTPASPSLVVDNTGGLGQTNLTYKVSIDTTFGNTHKLKCEGLDTIEHDAWLFRTKITNDSFPLLTLYTKHKKAEIGECIDASGNLVHCQSMIVQYHPDSLAGKTPAEQEAFKASVRESLGATPIDECLCGDIELWRIADTAMVEGFGSGTKRSTTSTATKPELLSADPNYDLLQDTTNTLPDSVGIQQGQGNTSAKTLVAIIDSGMDYAYSPLQSYISEGASSVDTCLSGAIWGYNFLDKSNNASDDHGHGTAIAGIVTGLSKQNLLPDTGTVAGSIGILPLKYTDKAGNGSLFHTACALKYAADYRRQLPSGGEARVRVINCSWGYYGDPCIVLENTIEYVSNDCGILVVASAGNDGQTIQGPDSSKWHWPSNSIWDPMDTIDADNILAVAAIDNHNGNTLASYSNYGDKHIDIAAQGRDSSTQAGTTNGFGVVEGTSFATAQVARAAALLFDKYPDATNYVVRYALMQGADILQSSDSSDIKSRGRLNYSKADSIMNLVMDRTHCGEGITLVGVQEVTLEEGYIHLFPNPVVNALNVEFDEQLADKDIQINVFNIQGQLKYQQRVEGYTSTAVVPTKDLAAGVYFIQIQIDAEQITQKFVKHNR